MPIYEYECQKCEKVHEVMQKFTDPPQTKCPDCGGPITKIMSRTSFQLKGSGWYVTDYKKTNSKAPAPAAPPSKEAKPAESAAPAVSSPVTDSGTKTKKD